MSDRKTVEAELTALRNSLLAAFQEAQTTGDISKVFGPLIDSVVRATQLGIFGNILGQRALALAEQAPDSTDGEILTLVSRIVDGDEDPEEKLSSIQGLIDGNGLMVVDTSLMAQLFWCASLEEVREILQQVVPGAVIAAAVPDQGEGEGEGE